MGKGMEKLKLGLKEKLLFIFKRGLLEHAYK